MILDTEIEIIVASRKLKFYQNLGYKVMHKNEKLLIKIEHLSLQSHLLVTVKCDICGFIKKLSYDKYYKNTKNINIYCCSEKCAVEKIKSITFKNHGKENYNNREKYKETCLEKYGFENTTQLESVQAKMKQTCLEKYGVTHNMKNLESFERNQLSGHRIKLHELTNIKYRGTYEKDFLDYCFKNKINVRNQDKSIKFKFENEDKMYHPDFYFEPLNLIIEIKSDYYFEKFKAKNLAKQKECIKQGYEFIFIINKNYENFNKLLNI